MKDALEELSYDWSLIDGEGLVKVITVDSYRYGIALVVKIGALADQYDCLPELVLNRQKLVVTIDDKHEAAYQLAKEIDLLTARNATD